MKSVEKKERNEKILDDARQGLTYEEIGQKHGITRQMVQSIVRRAGFRKREARPKNTTSTKEVFDYILEYKQEWSGHGPFLKEISDHFGLSSQRVEKALGELEQNGKISQYGDGVNRKIIVSGSTWQALSQG